MTRPREGTNDERLATIGEWFFGIEVVNQWTVDAKRLLETGADENAVRASVLAWAASEGLSTARVLFPTLNRSARRTPVLKLLYALEDAIARNSKSMRLQDFIDALGDTIGFNDWLADSVLQVAKGGEPLPMFAGGVGRVWVGTLPGGDDVGVIAMANSLSDPYELAEEFKQACLKTFPSHTTSRYASNAEAARFVRLRMQGQDYAEIALSTLGTEELARLGKLGPAVRKARIDEEADRIRKACVRFEGYLDTLRDELSDTNG